MKSNSDTSRWARLRPRIRAAAAAAMAGLLLAACGGGDSGGGGGGTPPASDLKAGFLRVHLWRKDGVYKDWGVYAWSGPKVPSTGWPGNRFLFDKNDGYGGYTDIEIDPAKAKMDFLVSVPTADGKDAIKNCGKDQAVTFAADIASRGQQIWLKEGDCDNIYTTEPDKSLSSLSSAKAYWLAADTLAWRGAAANATYKLHYAAAGGMKIGTSGVTGADGSVDLSLTSGLSDAVKARFPQLASATALKLPAGVNAKSLLKGQLVISQTLNGQVVDGTQVQTAGVLDDLYAASADAVVLGSPVEAGKPVFRLWAPTAQSVELLVYDGPSGAESSTLALTEDAASGVWSAAGQAGWINAKYYQYRVKVFTRASNKVETNLVTDPYSLGLAANSTRTLVTDLAAAAAKPAGWDAHAVPALAAPEDISIYELHLRDFSATDATVPAGHRGKFLAFTDGASNGMSHLKALQTAGLTHVHWLPVNDISTIPERAAEQQAPTIDGSAAGDAESQQAAVAAVRDQDAFNWGYDPLHYSVPEGSYATDPDGLVRTVEMRSAVKSLHEAGLRVVMDVVYNHTPASGQDPKSVLDRIVPGYYQRLDDAGNVANSTCCSNTATENAMMAKLMIDSVSMWASQYRVDAFRFDLMGHQPLAVMQRLQTAVNAAAGREIYLYGEGWNFGEVQNDARFKQATQLNLAGSGIGSFSDRLRDAARGGSAFDGGDALVKNQGFVNGQCVDKNDGSACSADERTAAFKAQDLIRLGLAGNLKDYVLTDYSGASKKGSQIDYNGQPAGYTADPQELISYVSKHDNQTLFDIGQYRLPHGTSTADRARAQVVGLSLVALGQGVPFFHAGDDLLRSKSLDRDSYNSGDWFNRIDWSGMSNNWAVGLPLQDKNGDNWAVMKPLLADAALKPAAGDIAASRSGFQDLLKIRKSTPLFRLRTAADVIARVGFPDAGTGQAPGLIVMKLDGNGYAGGVYKTVVVLFNADKVAHTASVAGAGGKAFALHPVQLAGSDAVVKTAAYNSGAGSFSVPARTTAVFVEP
ncbi:pullulanase-type alpha-1,6-glucosidase [Chitinimonas koreensis]|uniref:pullulanase-type alpha-1,6-glucosidase n=1 Tax=Chitinimonas koreensis TaxID=356302 RepID=UPI0003FE6972|nr:pullulanase-type alpha-1,6-glucosidase [Chitinimonas koreensis]QNM95701.1 pullulanase-type alpha-1,6-glucosidase [Chitinimonas koreensis]